MYEMLMASAIAEARHLELIEEGRREREVRRALKRERKATVSGRTPVALGLANAHLVYGLLPH
jgi:hypothetical protein